MTLSIDVTPREEAWLAAQTAQQGLPAAEIVRRLIDAQLPTGTAIEAQVTEEKAIDRTQALFAQWAREDATPGLSAKTLEAIAYLDARIAEGRNASLEERRLADLEVEELRRNLNANRAATGERQI